MTRPFDAWLTFLLALEGGYSNNPRDNGGMTNLGVTAKVWAAWSGKPATETIMRGLTREKVAPLYKAQYWDAVSADKLPGGLAFAAADFAVNSGPARAASYLQGMISAVQDGKIGPKTLAAVADYVKRNGEKLAIVTYLERRRTFLRGLADFDVFGRGWLNRVDKVERAALALVA